MTKKILLGLLPYWAPQIPPMGICCLKTFLEKHGYEVKIFDANVDKRFSELNGRYFELLERAIPESSRGNFFNVGQDMLRGHMMAHLNSKDRNDCLQLTEQLAYQNFFTCVSSHEIEALDVVLDEFYSSLDDSISELLHREKPDVFGLSVYRGNLPSSMAAFRLAKELYPSLTTVMGGAVFAGDLTPGTRSLDLFLEKTPYIDKLLVGEGELLFLKFLQGGLQSGQRVYTIADIDYEMFDLEKADTPDFSDIDASYYPDLAAYTSRSCPFQCAFCAETVYWGKYRKKNPVCVADELVALRDQFDSSLFLLCDSLLNPVALTLSRELIARNESIYWDGYFRAEKEVADEDYAFLLRRGGFYRARLGIESGAPKVLEAMNKKVTVDQIKQAVTSLAAAGIKTTTYWVIGFPGETEEDFQQTLNLVEQLKDNIYEAWCSPFHYFSSGQVDSDKWQQYSRLLFSEKAIDTLILHDWELDYPPSRKESYQRMNRFVEHCRKLNIPNPYKMMEFHQADQRWAQLHRNAVPPLLSLKNNDFARGENLTIKKHKAAHSRLDLSPDFDF